MKEILLNGKASLQGMFLKGSNYTFLTCLEDGVGNSVQAVYKPAKGEQPLWDFPANSLGKREAAAYEISQFLGWELVPPTVFRSKKLPLGPGSLQFFFRHDPAIHFFTLSGSVREKLVAVCTFDLLVNNADRKGGHILQDEDGHLWCIDQGLCFHEEDKLRTVIWDFAGRHIPENFIKDIIKLETSLKDNKDLVEKLSGLLAAVEIGALRERCKQLIANPVLPEYDQTRRMVPYPPL